MESKKNDDFFFKNDIILKNRKLKTPFLSGNHCWMLTTSGIKVNYLFLFNFLYCCKAFVTVGLSLCPQNIRPMTPMTPVSSSS